MTLENAGCRMQNKKPMLAAVVAIMLFAGCDAVYRHNPQKARETAYSFLNSVYMQGDFERAYSLVDADFDRNYGGGYLEKINARFFKVFGALEGLRAEAYLSEPGDRSIMLLFSGISEKAPSYHRITLAGDSRKGYRVSSAVYSDAPFSGYRTLKFFK